MKHLSTLLLVLALVSGAFAQTTNNVAFSFDHRAGASPLVLDQTVFSIWNGKKVMLTRAEFYLAELQILRPDNSTLLLTDRYLLVNANAPAAQHALGQWPVSAAAGLSLHIGVPFWDNHGDPSSYHAPNPLAPQNPSMHWGWSAGYRFMALEGFVDNNGDGVPEDEFEFHNLGDALYTAVELSGSTVAENGTLHLRLLLDYAKLFQGLTMTGNLFEHGSAPLNKTMMTNAATQNFMALPSTSAAPDLLTNALQVSASPNPFAAETLIQYEIPASGALSMTVTNTLGQAVRQYDQLPASGSLHFERGDLPRGIYQYFFVENGKVLARKQFVISE